MEALPLPKSLTYAEMAALYDALRTMKEVALGLVSQRRFSQSGGLYNEAGEFLDGLCELIGRTSDDLAEMAAAAKPDIRSASYPDDFAERALVLVLHEINCNGITAASGLVTKLYTPEAP